MNTISCIKSILSKGYIISFLLCAAWASGEEQSAHDGQHRLGSNIGDPAENSSNSPFWKVKIPFFKYTFELTISRSADLPTNKERENVFHGDKLHYVWTQVPMQAIFYHKTVISFPILTLYQLLSNTKDLQTSLIVHMGEITRSLNELPGTISEHLDKKLGKLDEKLDILSERQKRQQDLIYICLFIELIILTFLVYIAYRLKQKPTPRQATTSASENDAASSPSCPQREISPIPTGREDNGGGKLLNDPPGNEPQTAPCMAESLEEPEAIALLSAPPEEPWEQFSKGQLSKNMESPCPPFQKWADQDNALYGAPFPGMRGWSECEAAASDNFLQKLQDFYRSKERQVEIAQKFIAWAKGRQDGHSLLLKADSRTRYWFVGDIHGGFCALSRIVSFISHAIKKDASSKRHTLILLGDYIDRGNEDFAVLALVENLLMNSSPEGALALSVIALRGNHDMGLFLKDDGSFDSGVKPAEMADTLNAMIRNGDAEAARSLGKAAMELARTSPCMGELSEISPLNRENSILFTHGGLPHTDLQKEAYEKLPPGGIAQGLTQALPAPFQEAWENDFTWIRLVAKAPKKIPNRGSRGCEMGTEDVNAYRRLHLRLTGRAITFIIRGHDHEEGGYRLYSYDRQENDNNKSGIQRNCGVLTINALDITELEKATERRIPYEGNAIIACWRQGEPLSLVTIPISNTLSQS